MKNSPAKLLSLVLTLSLALALAGCGGESVAGNPAASSQAAGSVAPTSAPATPAPASSSAAAAGSRYASLEEYWADPAQREAFETGFATGFGSSEDDATSSFEVEGNTLICTFQFTDASMDYSGLGPVLDEAMEANAGAFIPLASLLDGEIGAEKGTCIVVMRYLDPDGRLLSEASYTALDEASELSDGALGQYETLEDLWNVPGMRDQLEAQMEAMSSEQLKVTSLDVSGNIFDVTFQITDPSVMSDGIAEQLEAGLDAQASLFEQQAAQFDTLLASGHSTIVISYLDPDGNYLAGREFTAD